MNEQQKFEKRKQRTKIILITISALFMIVMLVLPLFSVITNSLSEGFKFYVSSISTEYVRSALFVTILATLVAVAINTFFGIMAAFLLTKFSFKGKTGFGNFDRYSIFHFTSYRRTCILDDIWETWMDVSSDPSDQTLSLERISGLHLQFQESF